MREKIANPYISVVAPAYNEQESIEPFHKALCAVLDSLTDRWEIICVDDGSQDGTLDALSKLHENDARVKVLSLSRNFGKEAALTAGLDNASGDVVVPIDIDLQDPPELIAEMIELWADGADVVYATRSDRDGESWLKRTTASGFYRLMSGVTNVPIPRDTGDFRLMDRTVLESLGQLKETHRFMKGLFAWVGYRQTSLPYVRNPRFAGKTKWNYWRLWNFAIEGITSFSIAPLQIASYFGFLVSFVGFFYALYIIAKTIIYGSDVPGFASILVAVLFFGGAQLIAIGILGEYIGRIYNEVKRRPIYIVRQKLGL